MKLLFILLLGLGFTHTKLETRVYEFEIDFTDCDDYYPIDLNEISGIRWISEDKIAAVQDEEGIIFIYNLSSRFYCFRRK